MRIMAFVWVAVAAAMIIYGLYSYLRVSKAVKSAVLEEDNIYVCNTTEIFECRVTIFGLVRTVRLYYEPKNANTWKLGVG